MYWGQVYLIHIAFKMHNCAHLTDLNTVQTSEGSAKNRTINGGRYCVYEKKKENLQRQLMYCICLNTLVICFGIECCDENLQTHFILR